jgi:hypothetical protein
MVIIRWKGETDMSFTGTVFDGFGVILNKEKALEVLYEHFGEFEEEDAQEVIDRHTLEGFWITKLDGSFLFGRSYASMPEGMTRQEFERILERKIIEFLGYSVKVAHKELIIDGSRTIEL